MKDWRTNTILLLFILIPAAVIISRLVFLQIVKHDFYNALAQGQQNIFSEAKGRRGEIYFCDKNDNLHLVAMNKTVKLCFAVLNEIDDKEKTSQELSMILDLKEEDILSDLNKKEVNFLVIKSRLDNEKAEKIESLNLPGIFLRDQIIREYPYGDFASHIIGFVNNDGLGQYGVEQYYDDILTGKESFIEAKKGPAGFLFLSGEDTLSGSDLFLTIDYNIQFKAEELLEKTYENLDIEGGQIIVMDPFSGKVLAMAQYPKYDLNSYSIYDFEIFKNGAVQKLFEPGSVFKPITMAGALNEGKITPQTTYEDPGMVKVNGWPIYNYEQRIYPGEITMTEVLEKSINTGAVFAQSQLGNEKFSEYVEKFRFFEPTDIDLPAEASSQNEEFKKGYDINFATASFGQGLEMTPIQLVRAFCAIANGGKIVKPYLIKETQEDGNIIETQPEISRTSIISNDTSSKLTAMMVSVVKNGFAQKAQVPGYYVAGKTGTAQVSFAAIGEDKAGYSDKTWQSFIGWLPAFEPKFLVFVKLDNPKTKTAEYSAMPVFKDLTKYIIDYWQVPPDY